MSQITFGSNATPSLPNLDANFTELYNAINGTGSAAQKVIGAGSTGGSVAVQYTLQANDKFCFVDPTRTADNKEYDWLWSAGTFYGRFVNDAYSSATNWLQVTGGQASGVTQISISGNVMSWANSAGTEHLRKDASGNFFVGTTGFTPNPGVAISPTGTIAVGNTAAATGFTFHSFLRSGSVIGSVSQSGTTAVLYNTTSDARLKKDIVDAPECGDVIDAIKVRSFTWRSAEDEKVSHGFIAQELVTVAPQAVKVGDDGASAEAPGADIWAVDASKLTPLLVKEIQSLRARLTAAGL
jgi:hypothetical protein